MNEKEQEEGCQSVIGNSESAASPTLLGEQTALLSDEPAGSFTSRRNYGVARAISPVIAEDDDSITIRQPMTYVRRSAGQDRSHVLQSSAFVTRLRYYDRLAPFSNSSLMMPNHVVPSEYYLVIPITVELGKQSSLITIFSLWNTMMGTSILSMPWALQQAGFGLGVGLMVVMAGLALYTAYRVMISTRMLVGIGASADSVDFPNVCRHYLGRWAEILSIVFSLVSLLGAVIVYWVLMSNFLFHSVVFVHDKVASDENVTAPATIDNATYDDVQCVRPDANTTFVPHSMFDKIWRQNLTVPLLLIVFLFPLINCKSPTFFTKFNALGTVAVAYILVFVCIKSAKWGFHMNFTSTDPLAGGIPEFQWTFPALTGILSLAYFIHNAVISIMRNQRHPENNGRDLTIAYICVAFTYIFVGIFFYSSFPLEKTCIEDNLLNNFRSADVWAFVARIFLFFQMMTVFPLLMFIFRIQVLGSLFASVYPGLKHVLLFNSSIVVICVVMAIFLPKIGVIIRFSGALCGLVYVFTLPSVVYLVWRRRRGTLTIPVVIIHAFIIAIGVLNFIAQFLILEFK